MLKKTKICATIGPACADVKVQVKMIRAGMNVARLNFSHGTHEEHEKLFNNLRRAEAATGEPLAIMGDLQGPKIRLGVLPKEGVTLRERQTVSLNTCGDKSGPGELPIDFADLHKYVQSGERILIDDGRVEIKITEVKGTRIAGQVVEGGIITSNKGLNLPDSSLSVTALSEKDKSDLKFAVKLGVDLLAVSFVKNARDILDVKFLIKQYEQELGRKSEQPIRIIAKIERHEGVENITEILEAADGAMVARGDLGLEIPAAEVPLAQKRIIDSARKIAKPVMVATQMLDSMRESRRPTRAEVSDVANAVIDHADALMLSNETSVGKHPALVVETMSEIIRATEKSAYDDTSLPAIYRRNASVDTAVSELSRVLAEEVDAKIILAASLTGDTGRLISHVRPQLPILVATGGERVRRQLNLSWGVVPFVLVPCHTIEELIERAIAYIKKNKIAKKGERMIVVAGEPVGQAGNVNLVEVREIK
ncbi:pyruvate kinase [Patescibacteria group bacterium]|nr:MAG: pyruvate kinase [Patescibacteria group bacterium]